MIGVDFNLVRQVSKKSNRNIDHKWVDGFNNWIDKWVCWN